MSQAKPQPTAKATQISNDAKPPQPKKKKKKKRPAPAADGAAKEVVPKKKPVVRYPTDSNDISANWQRLQQTQLHNGNRNKAVQKHPVQKQTQNGATSKINKNKKKKPPTEAPAPSQESNLTKKDVWFDDVDPCLVQSSMISSSASESAKKLCKETSFAGLTRYVAMDCEMVGAGFEGSNSILARVSIVNLYGHCVYDKYVKPTEEVTDYRTEVSGIRPENLVQGIDFKTVQQEVFDIIKSRVLVGHAIHHDLKVLYLSQPKHMIRDTSVYFRRFFNNRTPSLKKLTQEYLGVQIQHGEHDSITDAQATMRLYTLFKKKWESAINRKNKRPSSKQHQQEIQTPSKISLNGC